MASDDVREVLMSRDLLCEPYRARLMGQAVYAERGSERASPAQPTP